MVDTVDKRLTELYPEHIAALSRRYDEALHACHLDAVVVGAGVAILRFLDDQPYPFIANPHFIQWLPLMNHPGSSMIYRPGTTPRLVVFQPDDYWHTPPALPGAPWADFFDIEVAHTTNELSRALSGLPKRTAFLGDAAQWDHAADDARSNPQALLHHLHYYRPFKTAYEIECIRLANRRSIPAHRAAEAAFRDGASEYDIWLEFLAAGRQTATDLPYPAIIAKNRHGAVLHYQHYAREDEASDSLLIDAAYSAYGYASDITRTWSADTEFAAMIADLDRAQQQMATEVGPGRPFAELHDFAHRSIAQLLSDWGLVAGNPDEFVARGITAAFFPHGLGHFLGIQVHEVGGSFADTRGTEIARPDQYPHLRLVRTLETNQVLTIEPGIYFIDILLRKLREGPSGADVAWDRVARVAKFGGIRIEDNVVVTDAGAENLTRAAFADIA